MNLLRWFSERRHGLGDQSARDGPSAGQIRSGSGGRVGPTSPLQRRLEVKRGSLKSSGLRTHLKLKPRPPPVVSTISTGNLATFQPEGGTEFDRSSGAVTEGQFLGEPRSPRRARKISSISDVLDQNQDVIRNQDSPMAKTVTPDNHQPEAKSKLQNCRDFFQKLEPPNTMRPFLSDFEPYRPASDPAERLAIETRIPYLRSCGQESPDPLECEVTGTLPDWLHGSLLRDGPGRLDWPNGSAPHVFDGMALMQKITIHKASGQGCRVTYQNRFLRSDAYLKNASYQRVMVSEFGATCHPDPCKTLLGRFASIFTTKEMTDNCNVQFIPIGTDQLFVSTETGHIRRVDPDTLETLERVDLQDYVATLNTSTAHPHLVPYKPITRPANINYRQRTSSLEESDSETDENGFSPKTEKRPRAVLNMGIAVFPVPRYLIYQIPPTADPFREIKVIGSIPTTRKFFPSYFHSFFITDHYIIFVEQSLVIDTVHCARLHCVKGAFCPCLRFRRDFPTYFHVVDRQTQKTLRVKYYADAFCFFHTINAYEERDLVNANQTNLVLDICCYSNGIPSQVLYRNLWQYSRPPLEGDPTPEFLAKMKSFAEVIHSQPRRYVLPLVTEKRATHLGKHLIGHSLVHIADCTARAVVTSTGIKLEPQLLLRGGPTYAEMSRINYAFNGKKYRYFYAFARRDADLLIRLMKFDIHTKHAQLWHDEGHYPSEPVFVARPGGTSEDDGVVLSMVLSETDPTTGYLLVLDAASWTELARARFTTPGQQIPACFHGVFQDSSSHITY